MDSLYHYCSNETFLSIVENREVWLSDLSLSNDSLEGKWTREVLLRVLKNQNICDQDIQSLSNIFDDQTSYFSTLGLCLSEDGDLLSQWRGYADDGYGVSIGFSKRFLDGCEKREAFQNTLMDLVQVEYDKENQQKILEETAEEITRRIEAGAFKLITVLTRKEDEMRFKKQKNEIEKSLLLLFSILPKLKNPPFHEEKEWRLISILLNPLMPLRHIHKHIFYRGAKNRVVPYQKVKLDQNLDHLINEVIIGPRNISQKETIEAVLQRFGFKDVTVKISRASYR